jgi:hypothetical protein
VSHKHWVQLATLIFEFLGQERRGKEQAFSKQISLSGHNQPPAYPLLAKLESASGRPSFSKPKGPAILSPQSEFN